MSTIMESRYSPQEIEAIAEEKLKLSGISGVPVNPLLVAHKYGIQVYRGDFKDPNVSGIIEKSAEITKIFVNQQDGRTRQRFTIAHELGHLFLHFRDVNGDFADTIGEDSVVMFRDTEHHGPKEVEANQFAATLLMPKFLIAEYWKRGLSIQGMAELFDVSPSAMEYRLINIMRLA